VATVVSWNGTSYTVSAIGERTWAGTTRVDGLLVALAQYGLQRSGGSFTLSGDVDWGNVAGHVAKWYKSNSSNIATTGVVRFANNEGLAWRNAANGANLVLKVNASDQLEFDGVAIGGTIPTTKGGTGLTSYATGDTLYASALNTLSKLSGNTTATRKFLRQVGDGVNSAAPAWDTLTTGDLPSAIPYSKLALTGAVLDADLAVSYLKADGSRALTGNWAAGNFSATFNGVIVGNAAGTIARTGGVSIQGTNTNDSAAAGYIGEVIESLVASGSEVSMTTATAKSITSISLTAGDWEVSGAVTFVFAATTTTTQMQAGTSTTTNTMSAAQGAPVSNQITVVQNYASFTPNSTSTVPFASYRVTLSATTTLYLVGVVAFGTSTCTARGYIHARRIR
jgi:hypothetical protein